MIEPLRDQVLIRRIEEPSLIMLTDRPKGIKGVILSCGPGKWIPGEWRYVGGHWAEDKDGIQHHLWGQWKWFDGYRQPLEVRPGMSVLFNSKWNDFSAGENVGTGSDLKGPLTRPLPLRADPMIHLVQEADIFCIIPDLQVSASVKPEGAIERQFMQNKEIRGPWNGGDPAGREIMIHHG